MRTALVLQIALVLAVAASFATGAVAGYAQWRMFSPAGRSGSTDFGLITWLNLATIVRVAATLVGIAAFVAGLFILLGRPRPIGLARPLPGLILALTGACVTALPVAFQAASPSGPGAENVFWALVALSSVASPLFLAGLGVMVLWDPALAWEPMPVLP